MKRFRNLLVLFLSLFVTMVLLNEYIRYNSTEKHLTKRGIPVINNDKKSLDKCSWACHDDTSHCKENHVQFLRNYFRYSDPVYFGIIDAFKSTGGYALANVIFLVIVIPLFLLFLLFRIIKMQRKISSFKFYE